MSTNAHDTSRCLLRAVPTFTRVDTKSIPFMVVGEETRGGHCNFISTYCGEGDKSVLDPSCANKWSYELFVCKTAFCTVQARRNGSRSSLGVRNPHAYRPFHFSLSDHLVSDKEYTCTLASKEYTCTLARRRAEAITFQYSSTFVESDVEDTLALDTKMERMNLLAKGRVVPLL